jgi:hypothetical protein
VKGLAWWEIALIVLALLLLFFVGLLAGPGGS